MVFKESLHQYHSKPQGGIKAYFTSLFTICLLFFFTFYYLLCQTKINLDKGD